MEIQKTMIVKSIKIENLFEIFDYDIKYPTKENVLIITGPNGFGKTQVLNILFNLFNRKFMFFQKLIFDKITICLNNDISIVITKTINKDKTNLNFLFLNEKNEIENYNYSSKISDVLIRNIDRYLPVGRLDKDRWIDHRTDRILTLDDLISEYADQLPDEVSKEFYRIKTKEANDILDSINVHLIREQRLFKKVESKERHYKNERDQTIMIETIQTYSNELRKLINERTQKSFIISQTLDSSYPNRLISEKKKVTKEEYDLRFELLNKKQETLIKNGLYQSTQKALGYSEDDSKALLVYLNDLEEKLKVFDDLLEKLELFTNILNERRFTFKSINVSREKGFYFETTKGKELKLNQLAQLQTCYDRLSSYRIIF